MKLRFGVFCSVSLLAGLLFAAPAKGQEQVELAEGKVRALLFRPEAQGPFPAVVALHGCAGLGRWKISDPKLRDWTDRLVKAGYAVLLPDTFGSRNLSSQCQNRDRNWRTSRERVADADAARRYLVGQPFVKADRISLIGWSNGATAVLWAIRPLRNRDPNDFRTAIAFYPDCRRSATTAWSARRPILILIGASDDWTTASACDQMIAGAKGRTAKAEIVKYPGAFHEFDHPDLPLRLLSGLTFSADGSGRAHIGGHPLSRTNSIRRAMQWLER